MNRPAQILLGVLTLAQIVFFVLLAGKMFEMMSQVISGPSYDLDQIMDQMQTMMLPGLITTLASLVALAMYLVDVNQNPEVDKGSRWVWMLLFIAAGIITMPVYYILYIHPWKPKRPDADA